ncbi:MAG: sugar transferase, partial [Pseudomonadota bacterium]
GSENVIEEAAQRHALDGLIVAKPDISLEKLRDLIRRGKGQGLFVKYVAIGAHVPFRMASFESMGEIPLVGEREVRLSLAYRVAKRILDLVGSVLVLAVMGLPMLLIGLIVRLTSPGPALFKQERAGYLGRPFTMYKFRTMNVDVAAYALKPRNPRDPRITRFGAFLRRSSLDELPQFMNVLRGEMGLVGPRPEMPFLVEKYTVEQKERLRVKPGITGLWQISADRDHPIHENIDYDIYYIHNQSILMDIIILFQTLIFAVRGI